MRPVTRAPRRPGAGYAARRHLSTGRGGRSGTLGGLDTASAAAQDARSSRMETPAAVDGRCSVDGDAGMDAS
ncbi:hypothetical protein ACIBCP_30315 [Streptomyces sp. NPDC051287]|uniref:hypothetical protein n=1 Tax=unclassified Streptomyces TaxID=2593676 RepID=UPI0037BB57FC